MLRIRTILLACIAMTLCSVAPVEVAQAQTSPKKTTSAPSSVSVVASVDRDVVELGGIFEYKINVVTSDARDIRLVDAPDLRPFSVVGRSQRPQILIRNNVTERRLEVVYKLRTRRIDDKIVIKPPVIAIGDERVSPKPITIKVVKKDGIREPFSREKIRLGLARACWKRPLSDDQIDTVVAEIESDVYANFETEIETQQLGEMVMEHLGRLDQVAYVRFASVYREFKDVHDFVEELEPILKNRRDNSF